MVRERLRLLRLFGYAGRPLTVALLGVQAGPRGASELYRLQERAYR